MLDTFLRVDREATEKIQSYVKQNIISDSNQVDRISTYTLYWKFYTGEHWKYHNKTMLKFNYVRAFINKLSQFLLGKDAFSFKVTSYSSQSISKNLENFTEKFFLYHWNKNLLNIKAYEMLQVGSVTGDVWVGVSWNVKKNFATIKILDSRQVFPKFVDGSVTEVSSIEVRETLVNHSKKYVLKVIEYFEETYQIWYQKTTAEKVAITEKYELITYVNPINEIPIVHIQNSLNSLSYFGVSDVEDVIGLNKNYNELAQELKSIVDYHTAPTTIVKGANLSNLTKRVGNVWSGLPVEADIFNLGLDVDLNGIQNFMGLLKTAMHEFSDIPENFLGKIQPISNTSAAALALTYQSIFSKSEMKETQYGTGIEKINGLIYKVQKVYNPTSGLFTELMDALNTENIDLNYFEDNFKISPVFKYGFPQDKQIQYLLADTAIRLRLDSRKNILNNMGVNNVPELLQEIEEDVLSQAKLDLEVSSLNPESKDNSEIPKDVNNNDSSDKIPTDLAALEESIRLLTARLKP